MGRRLAERQAVFDPFEWYLVSMRASRSLLVALAVLAVAQGAYYYPRLPEVMASHFGASGVPDGYESKGVFFAIVGGTLLLTLGLFAGLGLLLRFLPARLWNLPNRDYWLAPSRIGETRDYVLGQMEWFGVATLVLLVLTLELVFEANLSETPRLDGRSIAWILGGYVLFTIVWLFRFVARFRSPKAP